MDLDAAQPMHVEPPGADARRFATARTRGFLVVLLAAAAFGALVALTGGSAWIALLTLFPAVLLWVVSDLRCRHVSGANYWLQLLVAMLPVWGLLLYLLWSRRIVGVPMWIAFVGAAWIPMALCGMAAHGALQLLRGASW